jgi:hypothetical protein
MKRAIKVITDAYSVAAESSGVTVCIFHGHHKVASHYGKSRWETKEMLMRPCWGCGGGQRLERGSM